MKKAELIARVAEKNGMTHKAAEAAVNAILDTVTETLAGGEKVSLVGFGCFEVKHCAARKGRNPATGEAIRIEASKAPAFKAGSALKSAVR